MLGYAGKILEVDLSAEKVQTTIQREEVLKEFIGGRGLATKILWDRLGKKWETVNPIGEENLLLFLTGPLTGYFPGGRICVSGKSPQSNGVIGSTIAGEFPVELKCAGYDGIIVSGKADEPVYLFIADAEIQILSARHIWGKDGKQTVRVLTKEGRNLLKQLFPRRGEPKEPAIIYIGPAGENLVRTAAVMGKWTHAAGYGGYGAVMGSKNLKAVVVKGSNALPEVYNMEEVKHLIENVCEKCYEAVDFRRWGTSSAGYNVGAERSAEPIKNWQEEWHEEKSFKVEEFEKRLWIKKSWGDFGCPTTCLKIAMVKTGQFKWAIGDNPDYELQAYVGTNLGIFTPEANVYLASLMDDLGLCGIQTGNMLGFAGELYQRRILTNEDLDGLNLEWGNAEAFAELAKKIAYRQGLGDVLAEGTFRAAIKLSKLKGLDVSRFAVQVKAVAVGAHGIRSGKDYPMEMSYACSVQAGDHTSVAYLPLTHSASELTVVFHDSAVYCWFNAFGQPQDLKWRFYKAVTGVELTPKEWYETKALRIIQLQRAMLLLSGPDFRWNPRLHDENPLRFYEPLPSGPWKGKAVDKERFEELRKKYYEAVGWDENGIPKSEVLKRLGLADVDEVLERLRRNA
jgi:aldehyde:ferredoxin oxidoreductase